MNRKPNISLAVAVGTMLFVSISIHAQQVISSTGGTASNGSGTLSFTLGELVIDTRTSGGTTITQGFHQTKLTITAVSELPCLTFSITAFPNPTSDFVTLKTARENNEKLTYGLFDMQGKLLLKGELLQGEAQVPFATFAAATYIIKITKEGKDIKTLKIVKE
jgi:hypothetical protein